MTYAFPREIKLMIQSVNIMYIQFVCIFPCLLIFLYEIYQVTQTVNISRLILQTWPNSKITNQSQSQQLRAKIMNSKHAPFASLDNLMQCPQSKELTAPQEVQTKDDPNYSLSVTPLIKPVNRVQLKIAFLKYSRIHYHYKLRYSTLFHAAFLFIKCLNLLSDKKISFSQDYLTIVCLFLSMKYEEIYPPKLHHITSYFKAPPVDAAIYREQQAKILNILEGSLDVVTFKDTIDELLHNQSSETHAFAYYLLQLSLFDILIPSTFDMHDICSAIVYIMEQTGKLSQNTLKKEKEIGKNAITCSKLIASAIDRLKTNEVDFIRKKYQKQQIDNKIGRQIVTRNK